MKKFRYLLRACLLSLIAGGCCSYPNWEGRPPENPEVQTKKADLDSAFEHKIKIEKLRQSTVAIITEVFGNKIPSCAGVWIGQNKILTAAHCVDEEDKTQFVYATLADYNEKSFSKNAAVVGINKNVDLALLSALSDDVDHPIVSLSKDVITSGDDIHTVGHPATYGWTYARGYVSSVRKDALGPPGVVEKVVQISAPIWMGSSGGGAFDADGNLIGICSWVSKAGPNLGFFIHADVIEEFLHEHADKLTQP